MCEREQHIILYIMDDDLLDLVVIGAGPHALSLLTRLIDDEPDLMPDLATSTGNGEEGAGSSAATEAQEASSGIEAGGASSSEEGSGDDLGDFFDDMETDSDLSDLE